ncbi:uncharacterized protein [Primulina huaijiensis]|uniref:uncharacterized protein n=1 Tax=Primulina huaijiensis TaxID=1492673 RepID=UPI003CC7699B
MNKGSEDESIHGHLRRRGRCHIQQQNIFLPMFCRLSIKDVRPNQTKNRSDVPKPATISSTVQLKRNKTVTGFPSAAAVTRTPTSNNLQSHRRSMKKCASSEFLVPKSTTITTCTTNPAVGVSGGGGSCGNGCRRRGSGDKSLHDHEDGNEGCVKSVIGIMSEMDPPLPVVKRVALPGADGNEVNIWKRRFNGVALKSLQIEHQISPT